MSTPGKKSPADTKAVQTEAAEVKAEGQKSATSTPPGKPADGETPVIVAPVVTAPVKTATPTKPAKPSKPAEPTTTAPTPPTKTEAVIQTPIVPPTEFKTPFQIQLEEERRKADLNERLGAQDRERIQQEAHDKFFVDPQVQEEALIAAQSGKDGKMTEPNFVTEAQSHNALTAIETARLNEPDLVDAAQRGDAEGVQGLLDQQEELTSLVGAPRDHELNEFEKERIELLRSRSDMRHIEDPKNQVDEFEGTKQEARREMNSQRKEIEKAEKALEKELADIEKNKEKEQAERLKESEKTQAERDADLEKERKRQEDETKRLAAAK